MRAGQARRIAATGVTDDVGAATARFLLYGLLHVPGLADWAMHRRVCTPIR
ncbi:hypothetical protein [Streptomyces sp. NPDC057877]|uniref:hypothetical protein n=1 Tax=Streptomyces sp. NPDC057877 TaxID=3346269 RepID=UPI00369CEFA7